MCPVKIFRRAYYDANRVSCPIHPVLGNFWLNHSHARRNSMLLAAPTDNSAIIISFSLHASSTHYRWELQAQAHRFLSNGRPSFVRMACLKISMINQKRWIKKIWVYACTTRSNVQSEKQIRVSDAIPKQEKPGQEIA